VKSVADDRQDPHPNPHLALVAPAPLRYNRLMGRVLLAALVGASLWTISEYLLHRFAGHGPSRRKGPLWWLRPTALLIAFHEEHTAHHRDPLYFAPTWKKALSAVVLMPVLGGLCALLLGPAGLAVGAGYAVTYAAYELLHRRVHTHAPTNGYLRWVRRHHLHHHVSPKVNHGVTSPVWDLVFGTREKAEPVKLHKKLAPAWLLDEAGAVRREFASDYQLVGR
jgi:sterol desaturase/sphingolipid hydroxylase (fatty acid hydroxylase superfamily)